MAVTREFLDSMDGKHSLDDCSYFIEVSGKVERYSYPGEINNVVKYLGDGGVSPYASTGRALLFQTSELLGSRSDDRAYTRLLEILLAVCGAQLRGSVVVIELSSVHP